VRIHALIEHLTCIAEAHGDVDLYAYVHPGADPAPVDVVLKYDVYDEDPTYAEISFEFGEDA
jgi:hypothetical protein